MAGWPASTSTQPLLASPILAGLGSWYLCWILHSLWRLQHWGGWWEEGIWWVDKLKRQKETSQCGNVILEAWTQSSFNASLSRSSFTDIADIINQYLPVHRASLTKYCFVYLLLSSLFFKYKNEELYIKTNNKGKRIQEGSDSHLHWRGEKHFLSGYYVPGTFTSCHLYFSQKMIPLQGVLTLLLRKLRFRRV